MKNNSAKNVASFVRELVAPIANEMGYYIWDVEFCKEGADRYLRITLDNEKFMIFIDSPQESEPIEIPIATFASLPFKPGKYIELQKGPDIYRLMLDEGHLAAKIVNMVEIFYELNSKLARR